ncbi:MMPL family transporter [Rummeliibacillus stabekisii]|uniref:MMPL family transporter n=1 Tax=Rummeliibacillus stabekisii TaxID=241244 RepID=UPI00116B7E0C|nr:MMPL family transporter [Rummeliibacillus stabekisii]MBB5171786.1 RND superfamily putative drug exporter [Rummeliibacillus stabekisii]GEL06465.1 membrane protein [Rummeliibacillus stabekisii]
MHVLKDKKRWFTILLAWVIVAALFTSFAPHAKEVTSPGKNSGLPETDASIQAEKALKKYFPSSKGVPLFVVVHDKSGLKEKDVNKAMKSIEHGVPNVDKEFTVVALSKMPKQARASFFSEDEKTFFMPVLLPNGMEIKEVKMAMDKLKKEILKEQPSNLKIHFTGPAGIEADTYEMFSRADIVLILGTVSLIFVLLIIIYRSPLLAFIPLIGAGIAYTVVDGLLGLMGDAKWFAIDSQSLSIMMILLFAVITDYSLLLFSRFREELEKGLDINEAMRNALRYVREPIIFSGGTVLLSMLTLFAAVFETYRAFAPVFAVAVAVMLIAGLTLMPALFAIAGKKSFWPSNPRKRAEKRVGKKGFWHRLGRFVTEKPWIALAPIVLVLVFFASMVQRVHYTFNLLDSFPKEMSSIQGYNVLNKSFSAGEIAPSTVMVKSKDPLTYKQLTDLTKELNQKSSIDQAEIQGNPFPEGHQNVAKINLVLKENPYSEKAFDDIEKLRDNSSKLLEKSQIKGKLLIAGESAKNADIRSASKGDEIRIISIMTILIMIMLGIQTRSLLAPVYMMATILLSFGAALGFTVFFFQDVLDYKGISYRIPLYTFVFLVALGIDYSIMLISRIREEKEHMPIKEAVLEGVAKTGGVISSAGLILAATFAVLITQPVMELRVFGFAVAIGVLVDTFIVRPIVIPALIVILGKYSFWPKKLKHN